MSTDDWHSKCFYRVTLKAVIFDANGKVLMVREKNNPNWNLPGGGIDYEEDEYTALKRELFEEVGYKGEFSYTPLGIRSGWLPPQQAWQMWVVYRVYPGAFAFSVGEEATEIAFKDPEELKDLKPYIYQFTKLALESDAHKRHYADSSRY